MGQVDALIEAQTRTAYYEAMKDMTPAQQAAAKKILESVPFVEKIRNITEGEKRMKEIGIVAPDPIRTVSVTLPVKTIKKTPTIQRADIVPDMDFGITPNSPVQNWFSPKKKSGTGIPNVVKLGVAAAGLVAAVLIFRAKKKRK